MHSSPSAPPHGLSESNTEPSRTVGLPDHLPATSSPHLEVALHNPLRSLHTDALTADCPVEGSRGRLQCTAERRGASGGRRRPAHDLAGQLLGQRQRRAAGGAHVARAALAEVGRSTGGERRGRGRPMLPVLEAERHFVRILALQLALRGHALNHLCTPTPAREDSQYSWYS